MRGYMNTEQKKYNILLFGFDPPDIDLEQSLDDLPCNLIRIRSASEFYSIAFSRIFDAWIIDSNQTKKAGISISELLINNRIPHIFFHPDNPEQIPEKNCSILPPGHLDACKGLFLQLMHNRREQNRERYLAGYIHEHPGIESILTKSPAMDELLALIKDIAPTDSPVLIQGGNGNR